MGKNEKYIPLTIDRAKTKERLLAKEQELKRYAKRKRIATSTLVRILLDGKNAYPYQIREKSAFQKVLRKLLADGYLVEEFIEQSLDMAA
jgi:hypothetical protein